MTELNDDPWAPGVGRKGDDMLCAQQSLIVRLVSWVERRWPRG